MRTAITLALVIALFGGFTMGKSVGERIGAKYCNILGED